MAATITTTALAEEIGTDPRTLRKFLRSEDRGVGKGSRYELPADKRSIAALAKRFSKWDEARKADKEDTPAETPETVTADA